MYSTDWPPVQALVPLGYVLHQKSHGPCLHSPLPDTHPDMWRRWSTSPCPPQTQPQILSTDAPTLRSADQWWSRGGVPFLVVTMRVHTWTCNWWMRATLYLLKHLMQALSALSWLQYPGHRHESSMWGRMGGDAMISFPRLSSIHLPALFLYWVYSIQPHLWPLKLLDHFQITPDWILLRVSPGCMSIWQAKMPVRLTSPATGWDQKDPSQVWLEVIYELGGVHKWGWMSKPSKGTGQVK